MTAFIVMGPEGFPSRPDTLPTMAAARAERTAFLQRYERQGYYSAPEGRISLDVLPSCVTIEQVEVDEEGEQ